MTKKELPPHVARVLAKFDDVRPTKDGWDVRCPCPDHNPSSGHRGDHHPSLRVTVADGGRILLKCRVGCKTDKILETVGLQWQDVFAPENYAEANTTFSERAPPTRRNGEMTHSAYASLLKNLHLSKTHEDQLVRRGISNENIQLGQYKSLVNLERGKVARAVFDEVGNSVFTVPGFTKGEFGITLAGTSTGLLIPVRDTEGRIQAIKVRRANKPKYVYLTGDENGPSSGSPVHIPLGVSGPTKVVRVTEGELKSDVACLLDKTPTIGVPGVTQWRSVFPLLRELEAERVIIAFDAVDLYRKRPVFDEAFEFWKSLLDQGYEVEVEDWYDQHHTQRD